MEYYLQYKGMKYWNLCYLVDILHQCILDGMDFFPSDRFSSSLALHLITPHPFSGIWSKGIIAFSLYIKFEQSLGPLPNERTKIEENPYNKIHGDFLSRKNDIIPHPLLSPLKSPAMRESRGWFPRSNSSRIVGSCLSPPAMGRPWAEEGRDLQQMVDKGKREADQFIFFSCGFLRCLSAYHLSLKFLDQSGFHIDFLSPPSAHSLAHFPL